MTDAVFSNHFPREHPVTEKIDKNLSLAGGYQLIGVNNFVRI
ncbi:Uncharacterised protein [Yersinia pekkanenii]|uniref:Uncharacterized protein n=1 Tax=Yersinia pekkanenii TaxID=1288385 RepID=A0A0T9Q6U2_9GAMM|nr:Uncharacterised protein [Yersinia pekkanenii]CRY65101.1 Uncharacterised protein [Yersinia pekkanenii]